MGRRLHVFVLALAVIGPGGCGGESTSPSRPSKPPTPPVLQVNCLVAPAFRCTASLYGEGDVTSEAAWSAAESFRLAMDVPVTASTAIEFHSPGVPRILRQHNLYIRADYVSPTWGKTRNIAAHAYAVETSGAAVPLAYLSGETRLAGVTVEILAGEGAGRRVVTHENGWYMIEFLRLNLPFTARASKPGYTSEIKTHPGIVDGPTGYPTNTSLHFNLSPEP